MVSIKDIIKDIFDRYFWPIVLLCSLVGLLLIIVVPNLDFILPKFGIETKTSLRAQRTQLQYQVNEVTRINDRITEEVNRLKSIRDSQLDYINRQKVAEVVYQEKIKVVKQKIPIPKGKTTSVSEASQYYDLIDEAYNLAKGDE